MESSFHWSVLQKLEERSLYTIGSEWDHFNRSLAKFIFFINIANLFTTLCGRKIEILEFVPGVNIEVIDWLKNNGTKYSLVFDDSCEEICNSKACVDIAIAGRYRGLSTIYNKHNIFHQSKLGRDVELQNTHIVLFKSPRDVMQVTTLSTQSWVLVQN